MFDEMELKPLLIPLPGEDPVMGQTGLESSRSWLGFCVGFSGLGKPDPTLPVGAIEI